MSYAVARSRGANADQNKLSQEDRGVHEWYRFVLSFPPHLVREYLARFDVHEQSRVLDPFCGTGTTIVEAKKLGIPSLGLEGNPLARYAAQVKVNWEVDPGGLLEHANAVAQKARARLHESGISDAGESTEHLPELPLRSLRTEQQALLLKGSISPLPLHKSLVLLECLDQASDQRYHDHERIAFAKSVVSSSSNLHFGPEVGVGPAKPNAPVIGPWLAGVEAMARDLWWTPRSSTAAAEVRQADARTPGGIEAGSIDAVFCSPPYPNEKDYTRATRLESVLLGFIRDKAELRALKKGLLRSNTRGVYKDDVDDAWVATHGEIQRLAGEVEARRVELGKTSGFERMYSRVIKLYFGGMARHLTELRALLKPGARLAYVVGDQASFFQVLIRTGTLLAEIAESLGYELDGIDLFRTRLATATRAQLREEVVVLRWPGKLL